MQSNILTQKTFSLALFALALLCTISDRSFAYGPEGLFGGRPQPDSSVSINLNVSPEDRPDRAESVLEHKRPDYDPTPVTLGSFDIYPSIEFGGTYDTNIKSTKSNPQEDAIFDIRPVVTAASNWNRHSLQTTTYGDFNFYKSHDDNNFNNFVTDWQGRYDISNRTYLLGNAGYQHLSLPTTSADNVARAITQKFDVYKAGASFARSVGLVGASVGYNFERLDFSNDDTPSGGFDQTLYNRDRHTAFGKVSYSVSENLKPYIKSSVNWRDYDNNSSRQSDGYDAVVGAVADFGGITSIDAYIGWLSQNYENFQGGTVNDGVKFGGQLNWNPTGLTSVLLEVNRTIEETAVTNYNSYMSTGGSATITHELLRNVLIEGDFSFTRNDFEGNGNRQDDEFITGGGTRWMINQNLYTDFIYNWQRRLSNDNGQDYTKHIGSVRLGVQY